MQQRVDKYVFEYENENEFKKLESALKKYNMLAFKKLYFEFYPALKGGDLLGEKITLEDGSEEYQVTLPTDALFTKVHGNMMLHYKVIEESKTIILKTLTPEDILSEGHQSELVTYKGVMVSKEHSEKDMFKINLLNMIQK
ncbi:MAG: hypothetical protein IKE75_05415 [Bacilli bacterium]|nr:hypothetical protein [Bacilli bacterium]